MSTTAYEIIKQLRYWALTLYLILFFSILGMIPIEMTRVLFYIMLASTIGLYINVGFRLYRLMILTSSITVVYTYMPDLIIVKTLTQISVLLLLLPTFRRQT